MCPSECQRYAREDVSCAKRTKEDIFGSAKGHEALREPRAGTRPCLTFPDGDRSALGKSSADSVVDVLLPGRLNGISEHTSLIEGHSMGENSIESIRRTDVEGERWLVAALVLISFAIHLFYVLHPRIVWGDEPFYLWLGRNWLTGHGYQFLGFVDVHHPPLYPLMSGLLYLITHNMETSSDILYILFGSLLVLPMYGIGKRLYGTRAGILAGLLVALWPAFNVAVLWWGTMTEPPFYFFVALGLWAAFVGAGFSSTPKENLEIAASASILDLLRLRSTWGWGLAGLAFGLAYLTRPEGMWYLLAVGLAQILVFWTRRAPWKQWVVGLTLLFLGFMVGFVPYLIHTRIYTGSWMVSEKVGITFEDSLALARHDMAKHDWVLWHLDSTGKRVFFFSEESFHLSMWKQIRANPRLYAGVLHMNLYSLFDGLFNNEGYPKLFLPLLSLGLFGIPWSKRRFQGELFLLAATLPPLTFLLFFIFTRYVSPLLIPMLLWTGLGLEHISNWLEGTLLSVVPRMSDGWRKSVRLLPVLIVAAMLLFLHPKVLASVTDTQAVRPEHRIAGEWLASHTPENAVVMSRYPAIVFYAHRHWIPSPNSDYESALRYAAANNVDYWVVDGNEKKWRPKLAFLAEGHPTPELELVYSVPTTSTPVYVYRFKSRQ